MDARDRRATTVEEFLGGTAGFRTDLYATGGTLLSHAESIELFDDLGSLREIDNRTRARLVRHRFSDPFNSITRVLVTANFRCGGFSLGRDRRGCRKRQAPVPHHRA